MLVTNGYAQPGEFGVLLSLQILIGAAVAGLGSLWGVLVGAVFIGLLPSVAPDVPLIGSAHGQDVVFGLIVILIMLLLPERLRGLPQAPLNRESKLLSNRIPRRHNRHPWLSSGLNHA